jgi:hypothetical protein
MWSEVYDAFTLINENFDILVATVGDGSGLTPINFETLDTSVKPTANNLYNLGDITHTWKGVYVGPYSDANPANGVWLGAAQIKGISGTVELPAGSTVNGSLIIDPDKTFFKEIQVNNDLSIVATQFSDSFKLLSGAGVGLTVSSGADSIEIANTGILSVTAGSGISATTVSGATTVTNLGVRSLQSVASLPAGRTAGAGININGTTGDNLKITNTGVISISSGVGITISADVATGDVTITNSAPAVNTFSQIQVDGDTVNRLLADSVSDVLNINGGEGITLSKTVGTDTLTITVNPVFDLRGSVFADDSTIMVDAVAGVLRGNFIGSVFADDSTQLIDGNTATVYGNIEATTLRTSEVRISLGLGAGSATSGTAIAIGQNAGSTNQSSTGLGIGFRAAQTDQGASGIAIGTQAGQTTQGANAIAIGRQAGETNQNANSIVLNASGAALNAGAAGFYVNPIRSTATATGPMMYNPTTKELFYNTVLEFAGSTISTNDSSGITVDVQTTFNTDVTFDNDIAVTGQVTIAGDLIINGTTTTINSVTLTVDDKNIELGSTGSPTDVTADGGGITLKGSTDKTFNYVNSTGLWTANIGVAATSFTGLAAAATTASTAASVGYMGIPQSATATTATLAIGDAGKHIYVTTNSQTITIPANSVVAYPIGTAITFVAGPSATTMTIANNDTMYLVGTGTSGSRTLAAYGSATAIKVAATTWFINGSGLT